EERNGVRVETRKTTTSFDALAVFSPNADVLWPGALVQGKGLSGGTLTPIGLKRTPGTITLTGLTVGSGSYSREVDQPTAASVKDAIEDILASAVPNTTAARLSFSMRRAYSL